MKFTSTTASYLATSCRTSKRLRVLIVGPELLANALHALLATIDDMYPLSPLSEPDQVLPFIERVGILLRSSSCTGVVILKKIIRSWKH